MDGQHLACYSCGALVAVTADEAFDVPFEVAQWPTLPCDVTPGCLGVMAPEALN